MNSNLTDDDYERLRRLSNELRSIRSEDLDRGATIRQLDDVAGNLKAIASRVVDDEN